jgi:hypothetical protein
MRISITLSLVTGLAIFAPAVASAAPLALSDHAAMMKSARATTTAGVEQVRQRYRVRRCGRHGRRACSSWTRRYYWRPTNTGTGNSTTHMAGRSSNAGNSG